MHNQIIQAVGEQVWPPALQALLAYNSLTLEAVRVPVESDLASLPSYLQSQAQRTALIPTISVKLPPS